MNFATNFLKKFSPKSKQIKFRRINGNSSRVIVQNGPKKTTILMRGLVAFFLISTTASIYNRDKIVNQFGLDSGTKYTITVIDLDKKNLKNRNYFQTQTSFLSKEDISSQAVSSSISSSVFPSNILSYIDFLHETYSLRERFDS